MHSLVHAVLKVLEHQNYFIVAFVGDHCSDGTYLKRKEEQAWHYLKWIDTVTSTISQWLQHCKRCGHNCFVSFTLIIPQRDATTHVAPFLHAYETSDGVGG